MWFDGMASLQQVALTGIVSFIALIVMLRVAGKRTLTKMNAFDFIMTFTIGSTLATTITSDSVTVAEGLTALAAIILVQYVIAWMEVRFDWFQKLVKSQPTILFEQGEFQHKAMRKERISKVEVLAAMRYSGLSDPSQADMVLMETDGQLSVIPKKNGPRKYGVLQSVEGFNPQKETQH